MKSKFINVLVFAAGAAVGSAVTYKVLKTKYDQLIQEEIDSVRDAFGGVIDGEDGCVREEAVDYTDDEDEEGLHPAAPVSHIDWSDYEDLDEDELEERAADEADAVAKYMTLTSRYSNGEGGVEKVGTAPYVIGPYDFGTIDDYHQIELTYYADGILEDDEGNIVKDIDELIGRDSLFTFGEYEDDAVHVRNERLRADFEILKDPRTYDEANTIGPGRVADE